MEEDYQVTLAMFGLNYWSTENMGTMSGCFSHQVLGVTCYTALLTATLCFIFTLTVRNLKVKFNA